MSVLRAARRSKLPDSSFGLPALRKYPVHDKSHAANAKARATQQFKKGDLSAAQRAAIFAKANKVLGRAHGGVVDKTPASPLRAYAGGGYVRRPRKPSLYRSGGYVVGKRKAC